MSESDARDPGGPRNRERTRASERQALRLLMAYDPIGMVGIPEAADEFHRVSPLGSVGRPVRL